VLLFEHGLYFHFLLNAAAGGIQVDHAIRTKVLFEGNEFAAREAIEEHGRGLIELAF